MIILKNLYKKFESVEICNDVNFKFRNKGLTCFFGPSGSGKTTIFNLIAGFDRGYQGEIIVNDIKLKDLSIDELCKYRLNNIGFVFQNYKLFEGYTALENIMVASNLDNKFSEEEKKINALEILKSLGLEDKINEKVEKLSGGQKQRVAIGRALINNPKIILADEPTGALDVESTKSIMKILKEIAKDRQVIMISHDEEVLPFADEVIELEEGKIHVTSQKKEEEFKGNEDEKAYILKDPVLMNKIARAMSLKNFKIHIFKFLLAAIIIALGSASFVASLSTKEITNKIISEFKNKNSFYNIGNVPMGSSGENFNKNLEESYKKLGDFKEDIENVYYQYDLKNIEIKNGDESVTIKNKIPTNISKETLAYGNMPENSKKEIALSASIANRITKDIKTLIGENVIIKYKNIEGKAFEEKVTVSGITNSKYQDFILSSDIEKDIYKNLEKNEKKASSISFEVKDFDKIPMVSEKLKEKEIVAFTKASEVENFKKSFTSLLKLYTMLSYIILVVGITISAVILSKITLERYTEISVLGALGYTKKNIHKIMFKESVYFAGTSTGISFIFMFIINLIYKGQFGYGIEINKESLIALFIINLSLTIGLAHIINNKLIKTEIAGALRK